jgi:phage terminase large subunit-like protein
VEMNFGGAVVKAVIKSVIQKLEMIAAGVIAEEYDEQVAARLDAIGGYSGIRIIEVTASRGKKLRADPVVGLYQQRRVHHVGSMPLLEEQMATWVPPENDPDKKGSGYSPDRIDALVWAVASLMFGPAHPAKIHAATREIQDPLRRRG